MQKKCLWAVWALQVRTLNLWLYRREASKKSLLPCCISCRLCVLGATLLLLALALVLRWWALTRRLTSYIDYPFLGYKLVRTMPNSGYHTIHTTSALALERSAFTIYFVFKASVGILLTCTLYHRIVPVQCQWAVSGVAGEESLENGVL